MVGPPSIVMVDRRSDDDAGGGGGDVDDDDTGGYSSSGGYDGSSDAGDDSSSGGGDDGVIVRQHAGTSGGGGGGSGRLPWRFIDAEMLQKVQAEAVDDVVAIWGCRRPAAKALLMFYRWDKERLCRDLAERGEARVYQLAGVALEPPPPPPPPTSSSQGGGGAAGAAASSSSQQQQQQRGQQQQAGGAATTMLCEVCLSDVPRGACSSNACGHTFCDDCWRSHLGVQVQEGNARHLTCPAFKCGVVVDEALVRRLLRAGGAADVLAKYERSVLESFLEDNARVAFCPSAPWCGRAVEVEGDPYVEPVCPCGTEFCFRCKGPPHSPCSCDMYRQWVDKATGDSETRNWLAAHTKPCPKCGKPVEKNGGCNLVVCKCGQSFCYLCGQSTGMRHTWTQIDGHSCGRFREEADARASDAARQHKRWLFHHERFAQHRDSQARERAGRAALLARIAAAESEGTDHRDFSWLLKALDQLRAARGVLANSYAFGFFFFAAATEEEQEQQAAAAAAPAPARAGGRAGHQQPQQQPQPEPPPQQPPPPRQHQQYAGEFSADERRAAQALFEDAQEQLAAEVERLSGLVERAQELSLDAALRLDVINSSSNIRARILRFFERVENDLYGRLQASGAQIATYTGP